jgi:hypothetical protein
MKFFHARQSAQNPRYPLRVGGVQRLKWAGDRAVHGRPRRYHRRVAMADGKAPASEGGRYKPLLMARFVLFLCIYLL